MDANEIERYSEVGESGDGPGSMCDAVSLIASRLSEEYEQHTCLEAATTVLAEFTGWTAIVLDVDGRLIAGSTVTEPPVLEPAMIASTSPSNVDGWICLALPSSVRYVLCAETEEGPIEEFRILVMAQIAALTSFELRLEEAAVQERGRLRGNLAHAMLTGLDRHRVIALAMGVGHDLDAPHRVGVIADDRIGLSISQVQSALRRVAEQALVTEWGPNIAVVMDDRGDPEGFLAALDQIVPGGRPCMGLSAVKGEGHDLSEAVAEADVALSMGRAKGGSGTIGYTDLGVFRLFALDGRWSKLQEFVEATIGPLVDYDIEHRSDLVHTLDAYLRRNGSLDQLSESLMIHRSTLIYRLRRIRELLQADIDDSGRRLELSLAARAAEVLEMTSPSSQDVDLARIAT